MSAERDENARGEDRANEKEHRPFVHVGMIPVLAGVRANQVAIAFAIATSSSS